MTAAITDADRQAAVDLLIATGKTMLGKVEAASQILAAHRIQARKEAIEEAARVADATQAYDDALQRAGGGMTTGQRIAAAIRALGEGALDARP